MKHYEKMIKEGKFWVTTSIEIVNLGEFFDINSFKKKITGHIHAVLPRINTENLLNWDLRFYISFMHTDLVAIAKKLRRYPSDMQYEVPIMIAIPDNTQALYGMPFNEHGRIGYFRPANEKHVHILPPEYEKYKTLDQYVVNSTINAINLGFTKGFTCKGKKIKFQNM